ncbi:hypothetical protein [Priestia aryabhattai]|uniref:hypothetical protein n=1 Tax=Priestia aryabhattai TaxID=412384 RepID=UPI002452A52A|nr:hypothetical protein [Priestia aryabhattai]MDH3111129.1 hypothetical protein [Priestia aryabhattai]MDH3130274.1 hypothetical protein [Priestia aryabhattai]
MLLVLKKSFIIAVLFYVIIGILPELLPVSLDIAKFLFMIPLYLWVLSSNNNWWINTISMIFGVIIALIVFKLTLSMF